MLCYRPGNYLLGQIWTSSGVLISMAAQGMMLGYMSILLLVLRETNSDVQADMRDEAVNSSWIASSSSLTVILGFLLSSILMEVLGRKLAYMILILPGPIGLLLINTASSLPFIQFGRLLAGVTFGGTVMLGAVVIGEYTSPEHRGMFLNLKTAAVALGSTISHVLGCYYDWRTMALIILVPYVVSFLMVSTWVESPVWLVVKGNVKKGERNFYSLRGLNDKSKTEFEEMIRVQTDLVNAKKPSNFGILRKFTKRSFMRPVFIMFMSFVLLETSGRHLFPTFASDIIAGMGESRSNSFHYVLFIDIIITVSTIFSAFLVKIIKTRTLLFSTGAVSLLVLLIANTYLCLSSNNIISNDHPWLPKTMFALYFILVNLGCIPVPMALVGEIFPIAHKGTGLFVTGTLSCLFVTVAIKVFPHLLASIKIYGTFVITGMIQTIVLMILYLVLPETKNKTLQQIENNIQYARVDDSKSFLDFEYYGEKDRMLKQDNGS